MEEKEAIVMEKIHGVIIGFISILIIISLTACSKQSEELSRLKAENEKLKFELAQKEPIEPEEVSVNGLLNEFKEWDGSKEPGQVIYTLNLNKDTYILTIMPDRSEKDKIDWSEMIYIKPINKPFLITEEEIEPLQKLVSATNVQDISWISNVINGNIPYEENHNDWQLKVDYYVYQGKKEGIILKLASLNQSNSLAPSVEDELSKKMQEFADKIRGALNPVCNKAYFNSKGEFIIEVNSEWNTINKESKKDLIYSIENQLRKVKKELNVEGYGQFFSPTGRPLESFYAD